MAELLIDRLKSLDIDLQNYKVHLATKGKDSYSSPPLHAFFDGVDMFRDWQEVQTKRNFKRPVVLALIDLGGDRWLFGGAYRVTGEVIQFEDQYGRMRWRYPTELIPGQDEFVGRLVIHFDRKARWPYRNGENIQDKLWVIETLPEVMRCPQFPGLMNIQISHKQLQQVIKSGDLAWNGPLSTTQGVYVILDISNGKQYVGSACGQESIWQRWATYADNGHGGNKLLKRLLDSDPNYALRHFKYAILEVVGGNREMIVNREEHWKDILGTRTYGYNLVRNQGN